MRRVGHCKLSFMIRLIVGLGNPGPQYEDTRHNAGFWWVDALAQILNAPWSVEKSHHAQLARTSVQGQTLWLLKPQTFMNLSGRAVASVSRFYKIEASQILVAHDELDIAPGQAKLRLGGSHAGHNGLRDIHAQLGTDQYWRLRLGIGHPGHKSEVVHWVLQTPPQDQRIALQQAIDRTLGAVPALLAGDIERATRLIHTAKPPRPKPERKPPQSEAAEDQTA
ncbi:MAG: aminoacyl-tRNA hydrolase [Rhodoferax sp.]